MKAAIFAFELPANISVTPVQLPPVKRRSLSPSTFALHELTENLLSKNAQILLLSSEKAGIAASLSARNIPRQTERAVKHFCKSRKDAGKNSQNEYHEHDDIRNVYAGRAQCV